MLARVCERVRLCYVQTVVNISFHITQGKSKNKAGRISHFYVVKTGYMYKILHCRSADYYLMNILLSGIYDTNIKFRCKDVYI